MNLRFKERYQISFYGKQIMNPSKEKVYHKNEKLWLYDLSLNRIKIKNDLLQNRVIDKS